MDKVNDEWESMPSEMFSSPDTTSWDVDTSSLGSSWDLTSPISTLEPVATGLDDEAVKEKLTPSPTSDYKDPEIEISADVCPDPIEEKLTPDYKKPVQVTKAADFKDPDPLEEKLTPSPTPECKDEIPVQVTKTAKFKDPDPNEEKIAPSPTPDEIPVQEKQTPPQETTIAVKSQPPVVVVKSNENERRPIKKPLAVKPQTQKIAPEQHRMVVVDNNNRAPRIWERCTLYIAATLGISHRGARKVRNICIGLTFFVIFRLVQ